MRGRDCAAGLLIAAWPGMRRIIYGLLFLGLASCTSNNMGNTSGTSATGGKLLPTAPVAFAALSKAVVDGNESKVRGLLDQGADINENVSDARNPVTPLMIAVAKHHTAIARLLLERGAESELKFQGYTAEDFSIYLSDDSTARVFDARKKKDAAE